jgi:autotransporter adhesin
MNTIYRIVWSVATGKWVVASELAKGQKKKSTRTIVAQAATSLVFVLGATSAMASGACTLLDGTPGTTHADDTCIAQTGTMSTFADADIMATGDYAAGGGAATGTSVSAATAIGHRSTANGAGAIALGDTANSQGAGAVALGSNANALADYAIAIGGASNAGNAATASGLRSIATGVLSQASGDYSIATGSNAKASGTYAIALGGASTTGNGAQATGANSVAVGVVSKASTANSTTIGPYSIASGTTATALGYNTKATGANSVALGAGSVSERNGTISVGSDVAGSAFTRQVVNVDAGTQATDAVNVSQLTPVVQALGGGASINATTGAVTGPTYNVQGGTQTTVGGALTTLDNSVTNNTTTLSNLTSQVNNGTVGLVQQAAPGANLAVGKGTDGTAVDFADKNGDTRTLSNVSAGVADSDAVNVSQLKSTGLVDANGNTMVAVTYDQKADGTPNYSSVTMGGANATSPVAIHNVASGELSSISTDAVNGSQLYATNQQVRQNTSDISNLQSNVTTTSRYFKANGLNDGTDDARAVGAGSIAIGAKAATFADGSVAIGQNARATYNLATAVGNGATAAGPNAVALGNGANAANSAATAIGAGSLAGAPNATAVGQGATALSGSVALGQGSQAYGTNSMALGSNTVTMPTISNSVALGANSVANRANTVSVGSTGSERQITNVAAGTEDTDAVNVGQLNSTLANSGLVDSNGNTMDAVVYDPGSNRGQVTLGGGGATAPVVLTNVANGVNQYDAVNFGQLSGLQSNLENQINTVNGQVANIDNRVTTLESGSGNGGGTPPYVAANANAQPAANANVGDTAGVALGYGTAATGESASAVGDNAQATGNNSTAIGSNTLASGTNSTAMGSGATVSASNGVAVGNGASVTSSASNGTTVGSSSNVNAASGTAVGQGASVAAGATNSVALGAGSVATQANSVSVGSASNQRTITNVAAGVNATDAVNVSQLQSSQDWSKSYTDRQTATLNTRITHIGQRADAGTAAAMAMTNIPQAYQPNQSSLTGLH